MTKNESPAPSKNGTPDWHAQLAELQARYPKIGKPTVVAVKIVCERPDIALDDAKVEAAAPATPASL